MNNARLLPFLGLPLALALSPTSPQGILASEAAEREPLTGWLPWTRTTVAPVPGSRPWAWIWCPCMKRQRARAITVSAERQQAFGVRLAAVSEGPLESTLRGGVIVSPRNRRVGI